jgi:hypothetical protein
MNADKLRVGLDGCLYGLNSALAASRRTHSELDGFEVPRHTGSVKIEAVSCSKFEKKFAKGDRPDVIVGLRNSDNYRGGKEPAAVVVELVVGDELGKKGNTFRDRHRRRGEEARALCNALCRTAELLIKRKNSSSKG